MVDPRRGCRLGHPRQNTQPLSQHRETPCPKLCTSSAPKRLRAKVATVKKHYARTNLNVQIYHTLSVCVYIFSRILMISHEITMSQKRFMTVLFTAYIIPDAQWDWLIYLQNSVVLRRKYEVEPTNHGQKTSGQSPLGCPVGR